ncbi:MAG: hypothetical protein R2788_07355 [Saprospiraceae bacterium]
MAQQPLPSLSNDPAPVVTFSQNGYPTVYLTVTSQWLYPLSTTY